MSNEIKPLTHEQIRRAAEVLQKRYRARSNDPLSIIQARKYVEGFMDIAMAIAETLEEDEKVS